MYETKYRVSNSRITTYLAEIRAQLQRFCHSLCSVFGALISSSGNFTGLDVIGFGIGVVIKTCKGTGRVNLCLEAADNIWSAHMGL